MINGSIGKIWQLKRVLNVRSSLLPLTYLKIIFVNLQLICTDVMLIEHDYSKMTLGYKYLFDTFETIFKICT